MPIANSVKTIYPGLGSPTVSYTVNSVAAAGSASTLACPLGFSSPIASTATGTITGQGPCRQGKVRIKTEASVSTFQVTSITGKDATGAVYILFAGEPALAMAGIVDRFYDWNSDKPLVEIDIGITPGAATTISYEVVAGS